jgi:hypothetical protein
MTAAPGALADAAHPTAAEAERAHRLFEQSKPLEDAKKFAEAEKLLSEAFSLQKSPDIAANLGMCQASLGKYRDAAEHLGFALTNIMAGASDAQRARIAKALEAVQREVTTLLIRVEPAGAEVSIDGVSLGKTPLDQAIYVEPGERQIEVRAPGYASHSETLVAIKGKAQPIALKLERTPMPASGLTPSDAAPPPGPATDTPPSDSGTPNHALPPKSVVMIAEGALAAVGLGVGIGFLAGKNSASNERDQLKQQAISEVGVNGCSTSPGAGVCVDLQNADDRASRDGRLSTIGFVGAGAALVGLGATWLLWPEQNPDKPRVGFDPFGRSVTVSGKF